MAVRARGMPVRLAGMTAKITRINPEQLHETPGYHHITVV
ncbi:RidA family protein, partial [Streptomyces sp. NPDC058734]